MVGRKRRQGSWGWISDMYMTWISYDLMSYERKDVSLSFWKGALFGVYESRSEVLSSHPAGD